MTRVVIEFVGGAFDGHHFDSAISGQNGQAALEIYRLFRHMRDGAKRQERVEPLGEVIRRASPAVMARAEAEAWTEARRQAQMPYYDYAVQSWLEDGAEVLIRAVYTRLDQ